MEYWNKDRFINDGRPSFHIYSDKHDRIQFIQISSKQDVDFYKIPHGEVLVSIIIGKGFLKLKDRDMQVIENDQILLEENDEFLFNPIDEETNFVIQMVWLPGMNPCEECWEKNNKFFDNNVIEK